MPEARLSERPAPAPAPAAAEPTRGDAPRWAGVVARLAAVATALVAALIVVLLAACHAGPTPGGAPAATPTSASIVAPAAERVVLESPALAEAEALAQRLAAARAARMAAAARQRDAITAEQWRGQHPRSIEELLAGRVAGVQVLRSPDGYAIRVRGVTTLLGDPEPLVVLDGQPLSRGARELAFIDPADVARIEVLKDGASTAFYGVRGASGVLLITTRRPPQR